MQQNFKYGAKTHRQPISQEWKLCEWIYGHKKQASLKYFVLLASAIMQSQAEHNAEHRSNLIEK